MSKYKCSCGIVFKKKHDAKLHTEIFQDKGLSGHFIVPQSRFDGFLKFFFNCHWGRALSAFIIYSVLSRHFQIEWSILESILIGLAVGLLA